MKLLNLFFLCSLILFVLNCGGIVPYEDYIYEYSNELISIDTADGLVNTENGLVPDINELNNQFKDISEQVLRSRTFNITINGELNGFTWDSGQMAMVRSGINLTVNTDDYTGTINQYTLTIKYYTLDIPSPGSEIDPRGQFNFIKSIVFRREYNAILTHKTTASVKTYAVDLNLTLTGINYSLTPEDCIINGTRTAVVTATSGSYTGTWASSHTYTELEATRTYDSVENKFYDQLEGGAQIAFNGTYTGPGGIVYTKNITADVSFNKSRTVTITIDENSITINLVTSTFPQ
ncbi:MAG: hypothetical protein JXB50_11825 [Spirochaetes bacterium]|nr:hypothetical protein [Spirochaetota bacterium]